MTVSLIKPYNYRVMPATHRDSATPEQRMIRRLRLSYADRRAPVYLNGVRTLCQVGPMLEAPLTTDRPPTRDELEDGSLGSCGCTDYHFADCSTRTGYIDCTDEYGRYELDYDDPRNMDLYDGI